MGKCVIELERGSWSERCFNKEETLSFERIYVSLYKITSIGESSHRHNAKDRVVPIWKFSVQIRTSASWRDSRLITSTFEMRPHSQQGLENCLKKNSCEKPIAASESTVHTSHAAQGSAECLSVLPGVSPRHLSTGSEVLGHAKAMTIASHATQKDQLFYAPRAPHGLHKVEVPPIGLIQMSQNHSAHGVEQREWTRKTFSLAPSVLDR